MARQRDQHGDEPGDGKDAQATASSTDPFSGIMDQLKAAAEYFTDMSATALSAVPSAVSSAEGRSIGSMPLMPPMPGSLTSAQFEVAMATLKAQRASISALQDQLKAFDSQLGVLEDLLSPMTSWAKSWARAESAVTPQRRSNRKS